jgi:hypothetical protein
MIRIFAGVVAVGVGVLPVLNPLAAHHSFSAMYDSNKSITLTGKVTKLEWGNPHIYYYIDVTDATGRITNYAIEGGTPNSLQRNGWKRDSLKVGDTVTVQGFMARDGSNHVNGRNVTLPGGQRVFTGSADGGPGVPD